jgi:predicted DCC family thiol-disulfide oxidoreductase YuxK
MMTAPEAPAQAETAVPGGPGQAARPAVYFDGACPLCRREIGMYQARDASGAIEWVDVSACSPQQLPEGLTLPAAQARFHVRAAGGELLSGAAAFTELWAATPGFAWAARIARVPPLPWVLERAYRGFLVVRPSMQALARRLEGPRG